MLTNETVIVLVRGVTTLGAELTNTPSSVGFRVGAVTGIEALRLRFVTLGGNPAESCVTLGDRMVLLAVKDAKVEVAKEESLV